MNTRSFRAPKILIFGGTDKLRLSISHIISENISNKTHRIYDAGSLDQASVILKTEFPDLVIICDSNLQGEGAVLCRQIRQEDGVRHTGVILKSTTSLDEDSLAVQTLEFGFDDYLRCGCTAAELNARVSSVLKIKVMNDELRSLNHHLRELSLTDELTGLGNMRQFKRSFEALKAYSKHNSIGLLMLDLDHFKSVNDKNNHLVGSYIIAEVGKILKQLAAEYELSVAARYGGDEYIVALPIESPELLGEFCERIREQIHYSHFEKDGRIIKVTCSIGGAFVEAGCLLSGESIVKAADMMLYSSKNAGRNQSTVCLLNNYPKNPEVTRHTDEWRVKSLLAMI